MSKAGASGAGFFALALTYPSPSLSHRWAREGLPSEFRFLTGRNGYESRTGAGQRPCPGIMHDEGIDQARLTKCLCLLRGIHGCYFSGQPLKSDRMCFVQAGEEYDVQQSG